MSTNLSQLVDGTIVGSLATVGADHTPWNTPLHMAFDDEQVYWLSSPDTVHSKNIAARPNVSIAIWSRNPTEGLKGVYIQTQARALDGDAAEAGRQVFVDALGDAVPTAVLKATVYTAPIGAKSTTYSRGGFHYFFSDKTPDIA